MSTGQFILAYLVGAAVFLTLDFFWLNKAFQNKLKEHIGHLMAARPNFGAAVLFYIIYIFGLVYFVIKPAVESHQFSRAFWVGLLFGLVTYATFDLTSQAIFKNYPSKISFLDICWGMAASSIAAMVAYTAVVNL